MKVNIYQEVQKQTLLSHFLLTVKDRTDENTKQALFQNKENLGENVKKLESDLILTLNGVELDIEGVFEHLSNYLEQERNNIENTIKKRASEIAQQEISYDIDEICQYLKDKKKFEADREELWKSTLTQN